MKSETLDILYEDNHLIAIVKPAGTLAQSDTQGTLSLMDTVKEYLKKKYSKPHNVYLGLIHRLDRPVSGILLYAKTSKGASRLSEQFRNREVSKKYAAMVEGNLEKDSKMVEVYIKKVEKLRKAFVYDHAKPSAQKASLTYTVLSRESGRTTIEIELHTGRFHQIRATLSHLGHPIVGDAKYGSHTKFPSGAIALCAYELCFITATEPKKVCLTIDPKTQLNIFENKKSE